MIQVMIKEKSGKIISYEILGHAMSGTYGHDIVCSAVSVLSITTANNLEKLANVLPITEMKEGYLYVEIPTDLTSEQEKSAQFLLQAFVNAVSEVAEEYSKFIQLKYKS